MNAAELILNSDGSIYHLGLHPEQVAPVIITVGDQDRVGKITRHFDKVEHQVNRREFVTHTGWFKGKYLTVISTGIGPDNIDIVMNELDALANIDLATRTPLPHPKQLKIIRVGTTGGLQPEFPTETLVASTGAFGMDGLLQFYQAETLQQHDAVRALKGHCAGQWDFPVSPYYAPASVGMLQTLPKEFKQGITMTNPGFYGPQGRQLRAPVRFPGYLDLLQKFQWEHHKIVNLEMETAAIFGLSALLGHEAASLSVILANRAEGTFSENPAKAVEKLIQSVLDWI